MKKCVWCSSDESISQFKRVAHTIPQSLGGKNICENVCDDCNHYFGNIHNQLPAIEETLKETFNITRARLLGKDNKGANKPLARFKSRYFNLNYRTWSIALKPSFLLKFDFQYKLAHQFKRGVYKIYIEEIERQNKDGFNPRYDFIKRFSRYNEGNLPLFYFKKEIGIIMTSNEWISNPSFFVKKGERMKYLFCNDYFFEFELLGHVFGIVIDEKWESHIDDYIEKSTKLKEKLFFKLVPLKFLTDIDLMLSVFNDKRK